MAKAAEVIKKLRKDVRTLKEEVAFLKELVLKSLPEDKQPVDEIMDDDTWDPSRGPRPKNVGNRGAAAIQMPGDAGVRVQKRNNK